jgi:thiamine-phosphate diphosphorylase/hydroxyethylthiazole kinase
MLLIPNRKSPLYVVLDLTFLDLATARKLLGEDAIIGVTASSEDEALRAAEGGADYLGLGTVFATPT